MKLRVGKLMYVSNIYPLGESNAMSLYRIAMATMCMCEGRVLVWTGKMWFELL